MNDKKVLVSVIIFVILAIGIFAGVYLVQQNQDINEKAAPSSNLLFSPQTISVTRGQNFTTNSRISTGANKITGIDIEFTYNPAAITLSQMTPTSGLVNFTSVIRNEIDNTNGKARYIAYVLDRNLGISGDIDILTLTGTVLTNSTAGSYQISYSAITTLAALNESQNVVTGKTPLTLNVTLPTASSSPTPSPSPSPTVSPSPSPSPTPYAEIICQPQSLQTVNVNQSVSFSVNNTGRNPNLIVWAAQNGSPTSGTGLTFNTQYSQGGSYTVSVTDGGPITTCSVNVNQPSPSPSPSPSPVAYPNWDVDQNGLIDIVDIGIVVDDYGSTNPVRPRSDVDRNGIVNIVDIGIIVDHYQ